MASSPDRRRRTRCETCGLPYYAEKGSCPYCASTEANDPTSEASGFVFGNGDAAADRTTCSECGLPHYTDADGCPYCAYAGGSIDESTAGESPRERPTDDGSEEGAATKDGTATGGPSGLIGRFKAALGL